MEEKTANMKPCTECHSTGHLRIGIDDDRSNGTLSAEVGRTGCHTSAQTGYREGLFNHD